MECSTMAGHVIHLESHQLRHNQWYDPSGTTRYLRYLPYPRYLRYLRCLRYLRYVRYLRFAR